METFRDFLEICSRYGLRCWIAYGGLIGTVRHHGMIPWDDDIDVYLPREDFNRLLSLRGEIASGGKYCIYTMEDRDYYCPYPKFCSMSNTLWEEKRHPFIFGAFLDLFPLDMSDGDLDEAERRRSGAWETFAKYERASRKYSAADFFNGLISGKFRYLARIIKDTFVFRPHLEKYRQAVLDYDRKIQTYKGGHYSYYYGMYGGRRETFPKEWFSETLMLDYEDIKVPVPSGYDSILRRVYGDYMTPPPPEKQVSNHSVYFMDVRNRLSKKQIEEIIKRG